MLKFIARGFYKEMLNALSRGNLLLYYVIDNKICYNPSVIN